MAILHCNLPHDFQKPLSCPNLLLAQSIGPDQQRNMQPWADLAIVAAEDPGEFAQIAQRLTLPVIAQRRIHDPLPLAEARAACDALQRDLAPVGQFAGYIV